MNDEEINKILEKTKSKIAVSQFKKEEKTVNIKKNGIQSVVAASLMIVSLSGMVFAKDISTKIYNNYFLTGKGMDTAIEEGYIENSNMDYKASNSTIENTETGEKVDAKDTKIKVDEFVMDDFSLSITFDVELSESAKQVVSGDEVWKFNFPDLVISDENNIVLFCQAGIRYDEFSKQNNLGYNYDEALKNGKYIGSGANIVPTEREKNHVKVLYNLYTDEGNNYPKSKKLKFDMSQINISKNEGTTMGDEEIILTGNWNFEIDVPEKMYNRQSVIYKQISTTNKDFNVLAATLYDTGIEIKLKFQAEKHLKSPTTGKIDFWKSLEKDDKLKSIDIINYIEGEIRDTEEYLEYSEKERKIWEYDKYITNENGERFDMTMGPKPNGSGYIDENGIYESNCTFDLTKYNATDTITVYVDYHGNKADIVLKKVEG